jgi:hypothetical protein
MVQLQQRTSQYLEELDVYQDMRKLEVLALPTARG